MAARLSPFWRYYGGKFRAAPRYPAPRFETIVEPFAGAAGYALRHHDRRVVLADVYPVISEMWRYLISVSEAEILAIPEVDNVADLPAWVPEPARNLCGFSMNDATVSPCKTLSAGKKRMRALGRHFEGWCTARKEMIASQLRFIRHWRVIAGPYWTVPNGEATYFVDPPYQVAGVHYVHSDLDYDDLAAWSRTRNGQVIVCENEGASWLPFRSFMIAKAGPSKRVSHEVIWTNDLDVTSSGR